MTNESTEIKDLSAGERLAMAIDVMFRSREESAQVLGVPIDKISAAISNEACITLDFASRLYDVGINPDWIFGCEGFMLRDPKKSRFYQPFAEMFGVEYTERDEKERLVSFLGRITEKQEAQTEQNAVLMKQCEYILDRLLQLQAVNDVASTDVGELEWEDKGADLIKIVSKCGLYSITAVGDAIIALYLNYDDFTKSKAPLFMIDLMKYSGSANTAIEALQDKACEHKREVIKKLLSTEK